MIIKRVGVIGGGQLAWMMADAAQSLEIDLIIQTPHPQDPAVSIAKEVIFAAVDDADGTAQLAQHCDVITFENEFIDLDKLEYLESKGIIFRPSLAVLSPLLDKYQQRTYLQNIGLPVPAFWALDSLTESQLSQLDFPLVVKARRHGYDGQGTFIIQTLDELINLQTPENANTFLIEAYISFERELAVMAARGVDGEIVIYPVVETHQRNQVCHWVIAPAPISSTLQTEIEQIARHILEKLELVGILGIELFLTKEGNLYVNELAPRTHNSGHYTLDACTLSQFAMQLRAVTGLALETPRLKSSGAVMVNLLGFEHSTSDYADKRAQFSRIPHAHVHWYGKNDSRPGRKLGHVTVLAEENQETYLHLREIASKIEEIWYLTNQN